MVATSKRGVGKRGVASGSKKYAESEYTIEFDTLMRPTGPNAARFASWLGRKLKKDFPYHIGARNIQKKKWEDLWLAAAKKWHIPNDCAKKEFMKRAKNNFTSWRSKLVTNFLNVGLSPFEKYKYLNPEHWDDFVAEKTSPEFLEKSKKAKASARANKNFARVGRTGFVGLEPKVETIWSQLVTTYSYLKWIKNQRSKTWVVGRAIKNPETKMYEIPPAAQKTVEGLARCEREMIEDGSYCDGPGDPLTKFLGPEHGGRVRAVSSVTGLTMVKGLVKSGGQQMQNDVPTTERRSDACIDTSPGLRGSSYALGGPYIDYPPIEDICACDLLFPYDPSREILVGRGQVYPTANRTLHGCQMHEGFVKVQVDGIVKKHKHTPLHHLTCTDELSTVGDICGYFIQWPRNAIKLVNTVRPCHNQLSSHSPQFQTSPETNPISCDQFDEHEQTQSQHLQMDTTSSNEQQAALPAPPISKPKPQHNKNVIRAFKKIKNERPPNIQEMAARLKTYYGDEITIQIRTPHGMYPESQVAIQKEYLEYVGVLQCFANGWVDTSFIHWCEMFLYEISNKHRSPCAFFSPIVITGNECKDNFDGVREHLLSVYQLHNDKPYIVAPFLDSNHWVLFIVSPAQKKGYILDSLMGRKNQNSYPLSKAIEYSLGGKFQWVLVKCKQQTESWQCGYMVLKHMVEFVMERQSTFPHNIWNDKSFVTQAEIDTLLARLVPQFFREVFIERRL